MDVAIGLIGSTPVGLADIAAAENRLGFTFPNALTSFCLRENGGRPRRSWIVNEDQGIEYQVNWFIPIEPEAESDLHGIVHTYLQMVGENLLPPSSIPFSSDAGGNFFLLDREDGRIWFMPMDEWEVEETPEQNWARSGRTIAANFQAFLHTLSDEAPDWARE